MRNSISAVKLHHVIEENGDLTVAEAGISIPFFIARVFIVRAPKGSTRGQHAHKACSQLLLCSNGSVMVTCFDGVETRKIQLSSPGDGLLIPPGIWATQEYMADNSVLTVFCDHLYDENDYIRDYKNFLEYKILGNKQSNDSK